MTFISTARQFSYVWKQTVAIVLIIVILGSLLAYIYVQKRYTTFMERDYLSHWNAMQELQQEMLDDIGAYESLSLFVSAQKERVIQVISTCFQNSPDLFRLSMLDQDGILVFGKETKHITESFQSFSSSSPRKVVKKIQQQSIVGHIHYVQLSIMIANQHKGSLRGEFLVKDSNSVYIQIARVALYVTIAASACMVLFGIVTIFTRVTQHLSWKQEQLEEYAFSLEQANENLRRTKKELRVSEKLASLGYLAAGIAHEIGNPLGAVLGYVELLRKSQLEREKTEDILRRIGHEIERIHRIIQELVSFSRPRFMNIQKVDVNHILRKITSQLPSNQEKQVNVHLHLTEFALFAEVDEHKLQSVFFNILSNSIDAIETRGEIQISTSRRIRESLTMIGGSEVIAIQFSDTGCGISEENLSKIFDPFFTTKEPGSGMGLGLSLCHRIIESLNGEVEVHSTPGEGTDVTIFLSPARKKIQEHKRNA